ncbi:hypothetical protein KOI35_40660 [Actinoplanes bogorensis]|uniref:MarR family transcriptional regulator n=1 Tax=Paractinoplanes bogorensis TaxID=1610840 RepID=A0ABS5Z2U1_9ACTN|nr:hypothetical protein [Actinoplanes bogorensis]MBU2669841.1 hypothetical protein [Actinoplanes bogorensis]
MDASQIPEPLRARMAEMDARSPVEKVGWLLRAHVADTDGPAEIREELGMTARHSARSLNQALEAIDTLLTHEQPPNTLLYLVAGDGGRPLDDDPTDRGAAAYLRELAVMVREAIDSAR